MPDAGWYQDPHNPNQLRYWNGSTWTEHVHVSENTQMTGSPPFTAQPTSANMATAAHPSNPVNDIGEWLRSSFRVAWRKLGACFVLTLVGLLPLLLVVALVAAALFDLDLDGDQVQGFGGADVALLIAAGLVALASLVWYGVITIAQYRVLYDAHRERSITIAEALAVGRRNVGRLIVAYLIVYAVGLIAFVVFAALVGGLFFALSESVGFEETLERAAPLVNLFNLLSWPISLWLTVKLAFIPVAAAVAPRHNGLLRISMRTSDGRFWPVLGRVLLLSLVLTVVFIPLGIIMAIMIGVGAVMVDGGGSIALVVVFGALFALLFVAVIYFAQIMQASGISRLYRDLGGPVVD